MATANRPKRLRLWSAPRLKTPLLGFPPRAYRTQRPRLPLPIGLGPDDPPPWWLGDRPEWWVFQWLLHRGKIHGIDFVYQSTMFGGRVPFGMIVDFWFPQWGSDGMAWRVQGYYWHYRINQAVARDLMGRIRLESMGIKVVDILDLDIEDPEARNGVLEAALDGIELIGLSPNIAASTGG